MGMEGWNSQLLSFRRGPSGVKVPIGGVPPTGVLWDQQHMLFGGTYDDVSLFSIEWKKTGS